MSSELLKIGGFVSSLSSCKRSFIELVKGSSLLLPRDSGWDTSVPDLQWTGRAPVLKGIWIMIKKKMPFSMEKSIIFYYSQAD